MRFEGFAAGRATLLLAAASLALAACTTSDTDKVLDLGQDGQGQSGAQVADARPTGEELRRFCPTVQLREGTAYFNAYAKGMEQDPNGVMYQASIADVTRSCSYNGNQIVLTVAARGRVVPGPKGAAGQVTMPIRVAVADSQGTAFSELYSHPVDLSGSQAAAQFVFQQQGIVVPDTPDKSTRIFIGYDEGPYNTP